MAMGDTTDELCSTVQRPQSLDDIVVNIKFCFENNLFIKEEFYNPELLKRMFGGAGFNSGGLKRGSPQCIVRDEMWGFSEIIPDVIVGETSLNGFSIDFLRQYQNDVLKSATIELFDNSSEPTYERLVTVFGQPDRIHSERIRSIQHGTDFQANSHQLGGMRMEYHVKVGIGLRHLIMDLKPDGTLFSAEFTHLTDHGA